MVSQPIRGRWGCHMSEDWVQWQGHAINGEFQLGEYLGGSDHSAVFLTELSDPEPRKVAIKFIFAHSPGAELRFSRWKLAVKLSHPRLIRIFRTGRCELGNSDLLYAVMEFAEEAVSQVLPYRALTPVEVRDLLTPALEALSYLHAQGFVHAHIEPANILAAAEQVKLSSDDLVPAQSDRAGKLPSPYDPPEYAEGRVSAAGDIWSLGMTLVEILTQRLPVWEPASTNSKTTKQAHLVFPETLPAPFLEIARNCLRPEPGQRWKIRDIVACLHPASGKKTASVSPPAASPKPAAPAGAQRKQAPAEKKPSPATHLITTSPPRKLSRMGFAKSWPAIAAAVGLIAVLMVPRLFRHGSEAQTLAAQSVVSGEPARAVSTVPRKAEEQARRRSEFVPSAASIHSDAIRNTSVGAWQPGEVLDHVVPDVPQKARDTIHGKVRVSIKVHVDEVGNVAAVDFAAPGPSKYFANLALGAARRWQFSPAKAGGQNVPSDWILRFEFSRTDTQVFPKPAA